MADGPGPADCGIAMARVECEWLDCAGTEVREADDWPRTDCGAAVLEFARLNSAPRASARVRLPDAPVLLRRPTIPLTIVFDWIMNKQDKIFDPGQSWNITLESANPVNEIESKRDDDDGERKANQKKDFWTS